LPALGRESASPEVAMEHPAHLRNRPVGERPVAVALQADAPDQAAALQVAGRPLAVAVLDPRPTEPVELVPRLVERLRRHRRQVLWLRVDLVRRRVVVVTPLP